MRLKRLELSGFKSFAKNTVFELPAQISAIVGPNGSGKSNIVESIRWALGEQSLKNMRGKKSEDFIFNGSNLIARLGKASVILTFDPGKKADDFSYDEIIFCRRVYRDGVNEYLVNNSQVRLKDIVEMLGRLGMGTSSHHIIGQGEADRILSASPKEKRDMLEDALGLKIYQIKRREAEKKLEKTKENIDRVESLRKEIQPHLKFLRKQAEKVEKSFNLRSALKEICQRYFSGEERFLKKESGRVNTKRDEFLKELKIHEQKIQNLRANFEDKKFSEDQSEFSSLTAELETLRLKRLSFERELGRCDAMIDFRRREAEKQKKEEGEPVKRGVVKKFLNVINQCLDQAFSESVYEKIKRIISEFSEEIEQSKIISSSFNARESEEKRKEIIFSLEDIKNKENLIGGKIDSLRVLSKQQEIDRRESERLVHAAEISANDLKNFLKSLDVDEEKITTREQELEAEKDSAMHFIKDKLDVIADEGDVAPSVGERENIRREIQRLKLKLEDSEGIGEEVLKEYRQVKARDDFFTKEIADLEKAASALENLMKELGDKIDADFKEGVSDINKEFQNFFSLMFNGGSAELKIIKAAKKKIESEDGGETQGAENFFSLENEKEEEVEGIEISVSIPRKRIHSLNMLSGGERALTSIAFLFAMTQVNPPPFLVLDETDAALDESNSQKYAKMLKDLSKKTQLLIVTHNRETMKQAGALYGITMGSSGISQMLSIKFEEAEELVGQQQFQQEPVAVAGR